MSDEIKMIAARIRELREISGCSAEDLADELGIPVETYRGYEENGVNIPISALYHIANKFHVDLTEILTGTTARLSTYALVRRGQGADTDRYPGYSFQDLGFRFRDKVMEPLLVTCEPETGEPKLVSHSGQEFNFVLSGRIEFLFEEKRIVLEPGDAVYFDPTHPHGQRAYGNETARFLTMIAE